MDSKTITVLSLFAMLAGNPVPAIAGESITQTDTKYWITKAPNEETKDKRIERYLRGFDQPMWEVGERYERINQAVQDNNLDLALYHWKKIKTTIENGLMKRPARRANAEAIFLDRIWGEVKQDFASGNFEQARKGLAKARNACMACHAAEKVPFMNNQPLFTASAAE